MKRRSGRTEQPFSQRLDGNAMAHLDTRYCGQIFRRPRRLYDWRRPAAYRGGIRHHESPAWHNRAASLFGILIGAIGLGGLSDYFGRKAMFLSK
jgi:hypothetical protein